MIRISPQEALLHESIHALAYAEGTVPKYGAEDPELKSMKEYETQAIGRGSHERACPTENSFRSDLGLNPPRAQHTKVEPGTVPELPPPHNFRPGKP